MPTPREPSQPIKAQKGLKLEVYVPDITVRLGSLVLHLSAADKVSNKPHGKVSNKPRGKVSNKPGGYVDIRKKEMKVGTWVTTIEGLGRDSSKILKDIKKTLGCKGDVVEGKSLGKVIRLQDVGRTKVRDFLVNKKLVDKGKIRIHNS